MQATTIRKEEEGGEHGVAGVDAGAAGDAMQKLKLDDYSSAPSPPPGSGTATDSTSSLPVSVSKPTGAVLVRPTRALTP